MRSIITMILVLALAVCGWVGAIRLTRPSVQIEWVRGLYKIKIASANRIRGPKIVIIGGSGVHFGYSGELITRVTGIPTVNFGIHAGLGGDYLLYRAREVLRPGDLAILALEPQLQVATPPNVVLSEQVLRNDLTYLLHTPSVADSARILFGFSPTEALQNVVRRIVPWNRRYGGVQSVSSWGDETTQLSKFQEPYMRARLEAARPFPADPVVGVDHVPRALGEFFAWAKAHDIQVAQAWTPLLMEPAYRNEPYQRYFDGFRRVFAIAGGVTLGDPVEYFQPIENMFDYELHDNEIGRAAASETLAKEICKVRQCRPTT